MSDATDDEETERENRRRFVRRVGMVIGLVIIAGLIVALFLETVTVFFLLFAAILWTVLLRGLAELLAKYTPIPVRVALAIVLLTLLGLVVLVGVISGPNLIDQYNRISDKLPQAIDQARQWLQTSPLGGVLPSTEKLGQTVGFGEQTMSRLSGILTGALGLLGNFLVIFVTGIYLSVDPDRYKRGLVNLFPITYRDRAYEMLEEAGTQLGWWLGGRGITMLAVGLLTTVGLWLLGVPLAVFVGILSGLLTFVPVVGPLVSSVPAMLMGLLKAPIYVLYVAILYLAVQAIENYLLTPIVVGEKSVHIPPALLLLAQVLIGLLTGLLGVILATPLLVTIVVIIKRGYIEDVLGDTDTSVDE